MQTAILVSMNDNKEFDAVKKENKKKKQAKITG